MITRRFVLLALLFSVTIYALLSWNPGGDIIQVKVEPDGMARLEGVRLDADALKVKLQDKLTDEPATTIVFEVSESTPAGHVVTLMETAKSAGASNVEIDTRP